MKENSYPSFEHLPMSLNAEDISVPRDRFFEWMDQQIGA